MADSSTLLHRLVSELHRPRSIALMASFPLIFPIPAGAILHDAIIQRLQQEEDSVFLQHLLTLLQLQTQEYDGGSNFYSAVIGFLHTAAGGCHNRAHAQALGLLLSSAHPVRLDEDFTIALLSSPSTAIRQRMVLLLAAESTKMKNGGRNGEDKRILGLFAVPVVVRILLVMASDMYPSVRRAAVDSLVVILAGHSVADVGHDLMDECYRRACHLASDRDEFVRLGAVSIISKWAAVLSGKGESDRQERLDLVFLQLCSLSGDTCVGVRCKALDALGNMASVSEEAFLVSLSKKALTVDGMPKSLLADAAGAYIEGLADEFYEVRKSACSSLAMLHTLSNGFADDVLNLLTDMLNDDSVVVRLKAVDAISHVMATGCLKVQERHVVTLIGMLVDVSEDVRRAARQVLRILKLPDLGLFISTFNGLLGNIKSFVQDRPDCLSVIFSMGRNHLNFVQSYAKVFLPQIHPSQNGELNLDRPMVMAFLMLIVALILSMENADAEIRYLMLLNGISFVGKLSGCLAGILNNDLLLEFVHRYKHLYEQIMSMDHDDEVNSEIIHSLSRNEEAYSTTFFQKNGHGGSQGLPIQMGGHVEGILSLEKKITVVKCLLAQVWRVWPLIRSGSTTDALRLLRGFIDELEMLRSSDATDAMLVFAFQYMKVLRLIAKLWGKLAFGMLGSVKMTTWDIPLEKLDATLRRIICTFRGLSMEEESHIGELMLLACIIRLSNPGNFSCITIRKLFSLLHRVETLPDTEPSAFIGHLKEIFSQENMEDVPCTLSFSKLIESFSLRTFSFRGRFKHIRAEMNVDNNDSENPLPFISGLPVGIPFHIKLFNVSNTDKIWLQMVVEEVVQHTFLDLVHCRGSGEVRFCTGTVPLYETPDVETFSLSAAIIMESPFEDYIDDIGIGPKHEIVYLCEVKEIFLARMAGEE